MVDRQERERASDEAREERERESEERREGSPRSSGLEMNEAGRGRGRGRGGDGEEWKRRKRKEERRKKKEERRKKMTERRRRRRGESQAGTTGPGGGSGGSGGRRLLAGRIHIDQHLNSGRIAPQLRNLLRTVRTACTHKPAAHSAHYGNGHEAPLSDLRTSPSSRCPVRMRRARQMEGKKNESSWVTAHNHPPDRGSHHMPCMHVLSATPTHATP